MVPRRPPGSLAALLIVLALGAGCADTTEPGPSPVAVAEPAVADTGSGAVAIALRAAGQPVPDVLGEPVDRARRTLRASRARAQVVEFDPEAEVTAQFPSAGEALPEDGVVTLWLGNPPDLPPPPPPPPPSTPAPAPAAPLEPAVPDPPEPDDAAPAPPPDDDADAVDGDAPPQADPELAGDAGEAEAAPQVAERAPSESPSRSHAAGRVLEGPASWYGPGFTGNRTACGGRFDPTDLTMASRELPCGTRARVTGQSGRGVEVTVTDWGPATWTGKRFDLSAAAFAEIASLSAGVTNVKVEVLR